MLGAQERPTPAGTTQSPADGLTWATEIGTGEREAMRRASCTSEAVPEPPGKATTSAEAIEPREVWATARAMACASNSAATRWCGQARSRPPPAAITRERAETISGRDGIDKAMDSVAEEDN